MQARNLMRRFGAVAGAVIAMAAVPLRNSGAAPASTETMTQAVAQQGRALSDTLQTELVRRRRSPEGLGMGNGPGVDVSKVFSDYLPKGTSHQDVVATLVAAGFSIFPAEPNDRTLTVTKNLGNEFVSRFWTIAIVTFNYSSKGQPRLATVRADMKWSTL